MIHVPLKIKYLNLMIVVNSQVSVVERAEGTSGESNEVATTESFTAEEEILYNTRYAEGYNVYDPKYISWLKINHPDENYGTFLPLIEHFPEEVSVLVDPSTTDNLPLESNNQMLEPGSISDEVLPGSTPIAKVVLAVIV